MPKDSDIDGRRGPGGQEGLHRARARRTRRRSRSRRRRRTCRLVDSYSECLELIQNGAVDAVSTDDVILTGMIIQDDSLKLVGDELTAEPYGAGIKKGDTEFAEFVNGVLDGVQVATAAGRRPTTSGSASTPASSRSRPTMTLEEVARAG